MKISVIIATYNPRKWIDKCLNSLQNSSIKLKIIIIDNGSTDGSQEVIKLHYPEIEFIQSEKNLGFGKANNIGIKIAYTRGDDYVFLLNQDAWIEHNTIEKLINVAISNSDYGIISPLHLNGEGKDIDFKFSSYLNSFNCKEYISDLSIKKELKDIYLCYFVNAAAWLLPRRTIEVCGFFDPLFFHYGEDENFCQRVLYHNFKIGIVPSSKIYHDRPQHYEQINFYDSIDLFDKYIKVVLANVNNKIFYKSYKKQIGEIKIKLIINLITLNFSSFKKFFLYYQHLQKNKSNLYLSYINNQTKGNVLF
ncbi:MAG: glycosyltransferase family 2 protein [Flavobacterium sp.]|nr:glycosyltransferase family 2 protein [Flavobacterium sp.]